MNGGPRLARIATRRGTSSLIRRPRHALEYVSRTRNLGVPTNTLRFSSSLVPQGENLPAKLIDFSVSAKIEGEESQVAIVTLKPGETLRAESGAMLFMTQNVEMNTELQGASAAFSRMMTGQNMFLTDFKYTGEKGEGTLGLGTDFPSKILRLSLEDYEGSALICQRGAYLASNPSVDISMEATKSLSAGFFGGQGFILQRLSGQGDVLVKAGGTLVEKELQPGEQLRVTSGSIVAFTTTVDYDIQMMPGIKNAMFGGEGLFVTTLTGAGKVWLQGMPADRMIAEIARRVPSGGPGIGIPIGMGGGGSSAETGEGATDGTAEGAAAGGMVADPTAETPEDMVAATDQTVEADRQATVASSGMSIDDDSSSNTDTNSASELFGDAAPKDQDPFNVSSSSSEDASGFQETTFSDEGTTSTMDETTFSDDTSFSSNEFEQPQEGFWGDDNGGTTTDVFDSASEVTEEAGNSMSSIFSTLWDIFRGDD